MMGGLLAALLLLVLAAPASAAPPVCSDLTLDDVHLGESVAGQIACTGGDAALTYLVSTPPTHGSAFVGGSDGSVSYSAPSDYAGPDPFTVTADDGQGGTDTVQVSVDVTNTAPVCQPIDLGKKPRGPNTFLFASPDCFDADGDFPRATEIVDQPAHGEAVSQFGSLTYDPDDAYVGTDSFTYRVHDGAAWSQPATVTVELTNSAPQCTQPPTLILRQDKPASAEVQCGDLENDPLQLIVVDPPARGDISGAPGPFGSPVATYDPDDGFRGTDHMRLRVSDGNLQSNAFDVDLVITRNHAPQCFLEATHTKVGTAVLLPTEDVCFDQDFQDAGDVTLALDPASPPQHGTLAPSGTTNISYTPTAGYTGADRFGIKATDGELTTLASVPLHIADTAFCSPAPTLQLRPGVGKTAIADCTAPDFGFAPVSLVSQPAKGTVTNFFGNAEFFYTADQGASGADSFTFKAGEDELESPVATQNVLIDAAANEPPECVDPQPLTAYPGRDATIFPFCFDPDNDPLTYTVSRAPAHGSTRMQLGLILYTATAGYTGGDDLEITVTDGHGASVPVEQLVDVRPPRAPGCAPVEALTARPGGVRTATLLCTNPQGDPQTYAIAQQGQKGTVTAGDFPGQFRYTANAGASGTDQFTLRASNAVGNTDVPVDVTLDEAWNTAPHCTVGSATVARGTTTDLPLASRCADDEGDAITFTRASAPARGSVTAGPAATLQLTTDPVFTGSDSFTFTATDARGLASAPQFFNLNVVASLDPSCTPQPAFSVRPGASRGVLLNCQDPTSAPLTYEIVTGPAKGTLSPSGDSTNPFRSYTANAGASGADTFLYRVRSSNGTSTTYTQSITIDPNLNTAPSCTPNAGFPTQVPAGRARAVTPICSDAEFDTLTYQHVTQPQNGTVTTSNGVMTYTPAAGYTGPDEFTYTASDGRDVTTATALHLQVVPVTAPSCEEPDPIEVRPTGPARSVPVFCTDGLGDPYTIVVDDQPDHGTVTLLSGFPLYNADDAYTGADSFSYHATSANGSSETVTQAITVDPDANTAPQCGSGILKVKPGQSRSITVPCFDPDGDPLSFEVTSQPVQGSASPLSGTGSLTYTAAPSYLGPDPFTVEVEDGHGGTDTGTVNVDVTNANTPPSCPPSATITAQSGVALFLTPPCTDADGDPLTYEIVDQPDQGTISVQNGNRFYTSDAGYTGPDQFTFRASDGQANSQITTVNVNVTPAPGPVCQARSYTVAADATVDVDLDCSPAGLLAIQTPPPAAAGTLGPIDQDADSVRFTPNADFRGTTSFTFAGSSGGQTSALATITITVTGRGFAPNVFVSAGTSNPRTGAPVTFTASANDPDGGAIASYSWFVDGVAVAGTTSTLTRGFTTAGQHTVRVRVVDDEGDASEHTAFVFAHEGNQLPEVGVEVPSKAGTQVPVRMFAWAWDPDGPIAEYSWDFGDGSPVQTGASLRDVTHQFATAGTRTVTVTVTDGDGATKSAQGTIVITDANTAPEVGLVGWPDPALRGQSTWLLADVTDAESDAIAAVDWDLDGDGTYETDGGTSPQRSHVFSTSGDHTVGVRVEDGRGATATDSITIHVVNAPPLAKIGGPGVLDLGATGTYSDASTDDGSIVSRAWDTDNDGVFDDGTGATALLDAGNVTGYKTLRLRVTDNEGETAIATRQITVRPAGPVVITDPVPPPLPGGGTVNVGTSTDPTSGSTTITIPSGQVSQFPNRCMPLDIDVLIRKAAGATVLNPVLVLTTPGGSTERFPMTDANGDGTWTAALDCAVPGTLKVEYTIKSADGSEESFAIPVGKIVLIDPQGVVYDRAAFEAYRAAHPTESEDEARAATAIDGATVHLQRFVGGDWVDVNASDPGIDPNVNPQVTGANGLYRWDVSDGNYRVRVSAPGFRSKTSDPVVIPPPVLDLHMGLDRNPAPVAAIDAADEAFRGQIVTFTSDSSDDGSVVAQRWDLDDDGDFDDGTNAVASRSFSSLGAKTVRLQVTDDEGAKTVVEHVVTIVNRLPVPSFSEAPASGFRGDSLQFVAQASDADPGIEVLTFEWDTDGDGFDDGTDSIKTVSFDSLGAKTVRVRVTDPEGGAATAQTVVTILNRNPTVSATGPDTGFRGQDLAFSATGTDPDPGADALTFAWDVDGDGFDDGTGASKTVQFGTLGAKTVRVRVTDADGGTVDAQKAVTIENRNPTVTLAGPASGVRGESLAFTATAGDDDPGAAAPTLEWDTDGDGFDDGDGATKSVSYDSLGAKTVRVRASDADGGTATADKAVTIGNRVPAPAVSGPATGFRGQDLVFTAAAGDADPGTPAFAWDIDGDGFDDGTGASKTVQFATLGAKTVRVQVTDDALAVATAQKSVTIENRAPTASIAKSPAEPVEGATVTFTATAADPDPGAAAPALAWDLDGDGFDDGTGTTASRAFPAGTHTVRLRATDLDGGSVTVPLELAVKTVDPLPPPPPPPPPGDTKAPSIAVALTKGQKLPAVLKDGLKLDLTTDEACTATITVTVDKATARKLKIDPKARKAVVVGTLTKALVAGKNAVTVKLTAKTRKALKKAKTVKFGVAVAAKDAAGNPGSKAATLTLKK